MLVSDGGSLLSAATDGPAEPALNARTAVKTIAAERHHLIELFIEYFPLMRMPKPYMLRHPRFLKQDPGHSPEETDSWVYGNYPQALVGLPLADDGTVDVCAP